jgi:hypothetical protein
MASFVPLHGSWCWFKVKASAQGAREGTRFGRRSGVSRQRSRATASPGGSEREEPVG